MLPAQFCSPTCQQLDDGLLPWELDKRSEFNLLTGESDRVKPDGSKVSTLKDKVVHVRVAKLVRPHSRSEDPDAPPLPPYKVCSCSDASGRWRGMEWRGEGPNREQEWEEGRRRGEWGGEEETQEEMLIESRSSVSSRTGSLECWTK